MMLPRLSYQAQAVRQSPFQTHCWSSVTLGPPLCQYRAMSNSSVRSDPFRPAKRVTNMKADVWSVLISHISMNGSNGLKDYRERSSVGFTLPADNKYGSRLLVS